MGCGCGVVPKDVGGTGSGIGGKRYLPVSSRTVVPGLRGGGAKNQGGFSNNWGLKGRPVAMSDHPITDSGMK